MAAWTQIDKSHGHNTALSVRLEVPDS